MYVCVVSYELFNGRLLTCTEKPDPTKKERTDSSEQVQEAYTIVSLWWKKKCMFSVPITFMNLLKIRTVSFLCLIFLKVPE